MATKPEQLGNYVTKGCRKYIKRATGKWRRRLAKRLMDDTPKTTYYKGWT